ncbi:MAG: hypothetical protein ACK4XL_07745 [Bacteroidota bacterium]|jgi:hypothetical protein
MPIQLAPLVGAGLGALQQSKIDKALAGEKTYTKPKTIFGKIIGGVSGRSAAAEASAQTKTAPLSDTVMNSLQPSAKSTPITGGFSFGGEATKRTYLPFYLGAVVLGIFFFMRKKGRNRRR